MATPNEDDWKRAAKICREVAELPDRTSPDDNADFMLGEENKRLRAALKPFADAVYNDNGDMTVTPCKFDDYVKAYFVMRDLEK